MIIILEFDVVTLILKIFRKKNIRFNLEIFIFFSSKNKKKICIALNLVNEENIL